MARYHLDRRTLLRHLAAAPFVAWGCGGSSTKTPDPDATSVDTAFPKTWAMGGTVAMTDKATYPDPFTGAATTCVVVASTTDGPCTTPSDLSRGDISEGWGGLPMRLALRIVDASCNPVAGAIVKVWHTNIGGSYSGATPNNGLCLKQPSYASLNFHRGVQTTNRAGVVYFDTCFPGWYPGRAIHIHFQVKTAQTSYRISQLFFPEALTKELFGAHAEYVPYGQPNTTFANDGVMAGIPSASRAALICETAQMTDGALLASKTVTVI
ncbi:MAG TPA: hypothetical protein VK427_24210 [Kofleriaceae bacterium]|nr:hypothetical protein [Kofleriaceae bacterium]